MEILIISGLSGGGKSKAASFLEDMGFYIVDNMPAAMMMKFAEFCAAGNGRYNRVAMVYDVRTADTFDGPRPPEPAPGPSCQSPGLPPPPGRRPAPGGGAYAGSPCTA